MQCGHCGGTEFDVEVKMFGIGRVDDTGTLIVETEEECLVDLQCIVCHRRLNPTTVTEWDFKEA